MIVCRLIPISRQPLLAYFQVFLYLISSGFLFSYTYNWKLTHRRVNKKISEPKYQNFPSTVLESIILFILYCVDSLKTT